MFRGERWAGGGFIRNLKLRGGLGGIGAGGLGDPGPLKGENMSEGGKKPCQNCAGGRGAV